MPDSIAKRIVHAVRDRAAAILVAGGYNTDAGARVFLSRPTVDRADLPCVVVTGGPVAADARAGTELQTWTREITVEALAESDPASPGDTAEDLLADLQEALLDPADVRLGGLAIDVRLAAPMEAAPADPAGATAGAGIILAVTYTTGYGDPYN